MMPFYHNINMTHHLEKTFDHETLGQSPEMMSLHIITHNIIHVHVQYTPCTILVGDM